MLAERREKHFTKTEHALNSHRESWTLVQDCLMHHPLHFFFILNDPSVFDLTPPLRVPQASASGEVVFGGRWSRPGASPGMRHDPAPSFVNKK
jgi:hypothetical protein